jgi:hypothetical protein
MEEKKELKKTVGHIDKVEPGIDLANSKGKGSWITVIKAFNPLGHLQESYAKTLAYKIETKRLHTELERIKEQAKLANNVVNNNFKLKMEELQQRRINLMGYYTTVNNELQRLHIERTQVLEMAQLAQKQAFDPKISFEEKNMFKDMAIEMTRELPRLVSESNVSLKTLANALPPVEIPAQLLNE